MQNSFSIVIVNGKKYAFTKIISTHSYLLEECKSIPDVFVLNHFLQQEKNEPHKIKKSLKVFFKSIDNEVFSKKSNTQLRKVCFDWGTK